MKQLYKKVTAKTRPWSIDQYYKYLIMTKAKSSVGKSNDSDWKQPSEIMKKVVEEKG